ncbi:MAG: hypothetical protein J6B77_00960, partial [Clostridia bacterium]|nr:hypothetical protein [Clostridia bacterium]
SLFHRTVEPDAVRKASAVTLVSFAIVLLATLSLAFVTDAPALDVLFETVSATGTVGLSRNLTPFLNTAGKLIITCTMYLGRVGPISLAIAFGMKRGDPNLIQNPTESIHVG